MTKRKSDDILELTADQHFNSIFEMVFRMKDQRDAIDFEGFTFKIRAERVVEEKEEIETSNIEFGIKIIEPTKTVFYSINRKAVIMKGEGGPMVLSLEKTISEHKAATENGSYLIDSKKFFSIEPAYYGTTFDAQQKVKQLHDKIQLVYDTVQSAKPSSVTSPTNIGEGLRSENKYLKKD